MENSCVQKTTFVIRGLNLELAILMNQLRKQYFMYDKAMKISD